MNGLSFKHKGNFNKTERFLTKAQRIKFYHLLDIYGRAGVNALMATTPKDSGETATSWYYEISGDVNSFKIEWKNSKKVDGIPLVILLQYGHGTRNGAYVAGVDFINPTMRPIFDRLALDMWKEVASL